MFASAGNAARVVAPHFTRIAAGVVSFASKTRVVTATMAPQRTLFSLVQKSYRPEKAKEPFKSLVIPQEISDIVSKISENLAAASAVVPSQHFTSAVADLQDAIRESDLADPLQQFHDGKKDALALYGHFSPPTKGSIKIKFPTSYIDSDPDADQSYAKRIISQQGVPDILFSSALAFYGSRSLVLDGADIIASQNNQKPHVDFSANHSFGKVVAPDIIYFTGLNQNPFPKIATLFFATTQIIENLSDQEIAYLSQKQFYKIVKAEEGEFYDGPFSIIGANSSIVWDGALEKLITGGNQDTNNKLFAKITNICGDLFVDGKALSLILDDQTKTIARNYKKDQPHCLHARTSAEEEFVFDGNKDSIFANATKPVQDKMLPDQQKREIVRVDFSENPPAQVKEPSKEVKPLIVEPNKSKDGRG